MLETSKDLLFVVLALCILWLTIFLSWLLYYVISILRDTKSLLGLVKDAAEKVDQLAKTAQEKLDKSAATFSIVGTALKEVVTWVLEQRRAEMDKPQRRKKS
jgi:hypothetical protein